MNKIIKFCSVAFVMLLTVILAACSKGSGIVGILSYEATRNEIEVTAEFEKNEKLDDGSASVSIKLYDSEEKYKTAKEATVENGIEAVVTFDSLTQDTKYIVKLFVSVDGVEEEIYSIEAKTNSGGQTEDTAISITTVEEFENMKNDPSAYYKLDADLDFEDKTISMFGSSSTAFTGKFFGNNKTIKNITLSASEYAGVFGYSKNASIQDLNIESVKLDITTSVKYSGAVCGKAENTEINNVKVSKYTLAGKTPTTSSSYDGYVGGFVGVVDSNTSKESSIKNCSAVDNNLELTDINTNSSRECYFGMFAGSISGKTTVDNCYATGSIKAGLKSNGEIYIGGFAGENRSALKITNSYTNATITATKVSTYKPTVFVGGFIGAGISGQSNFDNCLTISDITVLGSSEEGKENTVSVAKELYVGGFAGKIANRSSYGISKCVYVPKSEGIKISTLFTGTEDEEDNEAKRVYDNCYLDEYYASLTIGYLKPELEANVGVTEDLLSLDITVTFSRKKEGQTALSKENVTDETIINELKNTIINEATVSSEASNVLSDALQNAILNK